MHTADAPDPTSGALGPILARADALYHDLTLSAVREHKEAHGAKAIGCLPIWAPRELVDAAGMLPVGLHGAGDRVEVIRGDAYFQSYICQIPRSTIEVALTGRYDLLDGFLFPAICDVIRNLSGMWKILFPGKLSRYVDVPQNFDPAVGGAFFARELRALAEDLSALSGRPVTDEALHASIARYDENRRAIGELMALRERAPHKATASESYLVIRAGDVLPVEEHTAFVRAYVAAAEASDRKPRDHTRVVVTGAFCEQPPLGLIRTLERAGTYIVWDDMTLGARWPEGDVEGEDPDPFVALARAYIARSPATASRYEPSGEKGVPLARLTHKSRAEGVIFAAPSFCDPALLDQPMLTGALDREGVPWTAFKYAENLGQFQVIREQAGTFADSIRLWSDR
ncbi:MAG: benzoyl-CoA reductase subunit C [Sandaracinaceae bacterium]|nr:benzoyl-CoA reductase subunit C [Sandaracinaceae bacterium]